MSRVVTVSVTRRFGRSDASGTIGAIPKAVAANPPRPSVTTAVMLRGWVEMNRPVCANAAVIARLREPTGESNDFNFFWSVKLDLRVRAASARTSMSVPSRREALH